MSDCAADVSRTGMSEAVSTVVSVANGHAWVEAEPQAACGACAAGRGCGVGLLAKGLGRRPVRLRIRDDFQARVGDRIVIGVSGGTITAAAFLAFLTPIAAMLAATAAARWLGGGELLPQWPKLARTAQRLANRPKSSKRRTNPGRK